MKCSNLLKEALDNLPNPSGDIELDNFLNDYTGSEFIKINNKLSKNKKYRERVSNLLDRLPKFIGTTYRGTNLPSSKLNKLKIGNKFQLGRIGSTSADREEAESFMSLNHNDNPVLFTIIDDTGNYLRDIRHIIDYEQEVLVKPDTTLEVIAIKEYTPQNSWLKSLYNHKTEREAIINAKVYLGFNHESMPDFIKEYRKFKTIKSVVLQAVGKGGPILGISSLIFDNRKNNEMQ